GSARTAEAVRAAFAEPEDAPTRALSRQLTETGDRLFARAGLQLSVARHGASNWERGANLDRAMTELSDRSALTRAIEKALTRPDEAQRIAALERLGDRADSAHHALYDDLGREGLQPHLVNPPGTNRDVQGRSGAIDGVADRLPRDGWRMAELTYAESLYERPLELAYRGLAPFTSYCLRYTWAGEGYARSVQVSANGTVLRPFHPRLTNPAYAQLAIAPQLIHAGRLRVRFTGEPGLGGSGRGVQIAESWLLALPPEQCSGGWQDPDAADGRTAMP
ncbi:hypothetical protein MTR62_08230, partial [Novosphingobium sp. 1949]|nr:hypothetical protein [Novosphingobium organovorum]